MGEALPFTAVSPAAAAIDFVAHLLKKGGHISKIKPLPKKFQHGGSVGAQGRSTVTNVATSEGAPTGITQTHTIDKNKGF